MSAHDASEPIHSFFARNPSHRNFTITAVGLGLSAGAAGSL